MMRRPRFKPHLRVEVVPGEGVFLLSEQEQLVLQGRLYELVASCLDGSPAEEVCARLRGQASPAEVSYTIARLEQKGCLTDGDAPVPPGEAALWSIQGVDPAEAARRLAETPVSVRAVGDVDDGPFRELLRSLRVRVEDGGRLTVVITDGYLRSGLEECNTEALRDGPAVAAGQAGRRAGLARPAVRARQDRLLALPGGADAGQLAGGRLPGAERAGARGACPAVDRAARRPRCRSASAWPPTPRRRGSARGGLPELEGKDSDSGHPHGAESDARAGPPAVLPGVRPAGPDRPPSRKPLVLQSSRKTYTQDGGHRSITPEQTLERYGHHVSPITGAVPLLERNGADGDGVVHVYLSGHNAARRSRTLRGLRGDLRSSNAGKGTTDVQAKASALCEGLERYSGVFRGDEPRRQARLVDLGDAGIHPHTCMLFSDKQYRERDAWNARGSRFDIVPVPFDPEAEIDWTPVWSLTRGEARYLPTAFCYFDYPQDRDRAVCWSCSNGNAAGNTREEAILQGFLELVERDSVALWWYNRVRRPAVDLDSFDEPYLGELRTFLREAPARPLGPGRDVRPGHSGVRGGDAADGRGGGADPVRLRRPPRRPPGAAAGRDRDEPDARPRPARAGRRAGRRPHHGPRHGRLAAHGDGRQPAVPGAAGRAGADGGVVSGRAAPTTSRTTCWPARRWSSGGGWRCWCSTRRDPRSACRWSR